MATLFQVIDSDLAFMQLVIKDSLQNINNVYNNIQSKIIDQDYQNLSLEDKNNLNNILTRYNSGLNSSINSLISLRNQIEQERIKNLKNIVGV